MSRWRRHVCIPDTQVRAGVSTKHLVAAGNYIAEKAPDVVVHLGDHWDLPSLNSHGKKIEIEGKRIQQDIEVGNEALALLTKAIRGRKGYNPRLVLLRGNHEERLNRAIGDDPRLDGLVGSQSFNDRALGWEVHDFLNVVPIDGILYSHYFYAPLTGRPYGGDARYKLGRIHRSFTQGHVQGISTAQLEVPGGKRIRGLVCGSFYSHDESYKGPQANNHWRGIVVKNEVREGDYDATEVSLGYLLRRYA